MPSIEARLKSSAADADAVSNRSDRKFADAVFLSASTLTPELSRVNSTPLSSDAVEALSLQNQTTSTGTDSREDPSPLTMAPPKPGPADTLYPSPSGGFVPSPEEGQDWRLKPPPPGRTINSASDSASSSSSVAATSSAPRVLTSVAEASRRLLSCLSPTALSNTSTPTRPPSLPPSDETAAKIASASPRSRRSSQASNSAASPQLRPNLSSSNSQNRLSTASATALDSSASGRQSSLLPAETRPYAAQDFTAALQDDAVETKSSRPNSTSSYQTARLQDDKQNASSLIKVRDFAYPPEDPRHLGAQLLDSQRSTDTDYTQGAHHDDADAEENEFYIEGAEDENEFDGDDGDNANVPEGVYKVLYEFNPESEHELAVQPGEVVHVVGSIEGGWAIAIKDAQDEFKGLVPATYLEWTGPLPE